MPEWFEITLNLSSRHGLVGLGYVAMWHVVATKGAISRTNAKYAVLFIGATCSALVALEVYLNL